MEIGSFIELEFNKSGEYYSGENVIRLNSGRAGIFHAIRVLGCTSVWIPYYQCDTVRDFLLKKGIEVKYYHIDKSFTPIDLLPADDEAVIIVNYYGIMSYSRMESLASVYKNVIIDNSQSFFTKPVKKCMNVYSARKFVGVPDGAYVIGNGVNSVNDYERIEYGCEGQTYAARCRNEERIDNSDILNMSELSKLILSSADYDSNRNKRIENFKIACEFFNRINKINPLIHYDDTCVPMVYPLVIENDNLLSYLLENKIFQGHWWDYILDEVNPDTFEYYISRYIIPITIDQRYGKNELEYTYNLAKGFLG